MNEGVDIRTAVACNLDRELLQTTLPLFAESRIEAIEWSFDALHNVQHIPEWFTDLLHAYASVGRLIGHGIFFSLFSGKWSAEQESWLRHLQKVSGYFQFDHITEHFGFMTGSDFHKGAPISIPYTASTLAIGRDRLLRIADACNCPVGLENLAFSYSEAEVRKHGEFLDRLVSPVNGFIILDLHNVYCQLHNFSLDAAAVANLYPLHLVREIHLSGGSWETTATEPVKTIRRDTHDDAVPEAVFDLLEQLLPCCPNLRYVVLEQLGTALRTEERQQQFRADFSRMEQIVKHYLRSGSHPGPTNAFLPALTGLPPSAAEDQLLHQQQLELSVILETAADTDAAMAALKRSSLADSAWNCEAWSPHMLETALRIAQKWKDGWKSH